MLFQSKLIAHFVDVGEWLRLPSEYLVREDRDKKFSLRNTISRNYMSAILQYRSQEASTFFIQSLTFTVLRCFKWTFINQLFFRQGWFQWIYWNYSSEEYSKASLIFQKKNYKNDLKL